MASLTTISKQVTKLTFVTGNAKKLEEVKQIFGSSLQIESKAVDCNKFKEFVKI